MVVSSYVEITIEQFYHLSHCPIFWVHFYDIDELAEVISLLNSWSGDWWFTDNDQSYYSIKVLADLSTYGIGITQQDFRSKLKNVIKCGGPNLTALLAITSRSLLIDGVAQQNVLWGTYPSSSSKNDDTEVLSDFTYRLRTTISQARHAKYGEPLFIRHKPVPKRSLGQSSCPREDPSEQIESIHLNPKYKNSLKNKHVIVVDDCTTYGVSFGVAAALLKKAKVASVTCIALGKFGNQLRQYEIDINADPFEPIAQSGYKVQNMQFCIGITNPTSQHILTSLIP